MSDDKNQMTPSTPEERARKQARARSLTDPLGALGFRDTRSRYRREARARRAIFGGAAASFVVGTALIVAASNNGGDSTPQVEAATTQAQQTSSGPAQPATGLSVETSEKAKVVLGLAVADGVSNASLVNNQSALPTAVIPSYGSSSSDHESDDHEGDHHDDHGDDHEGKHDDDHDDHENSYPVSAQPQLATSSDNQTVDRSSITVTQQQPHTRTNSTGS